MEIVNKYLKLELFSKNFNVVINDMIAKNHSIVAVILNHIKKNIENQNLPKHDEFMKIKSHRMIDYKKIDGDYYLTYLALDKEPTINESGDWGNKNRQRIKLGKGVKKFITPYLDVLDVVLSDSDIEEFVNEIKALLTNDNYIFKLVSGSDIIDYYNEDTYYDMTQDSTLSKSCMRYDKCSDWLSLYEENNDCELLIMFDKSLSLDKIIARAIVWTYNGVKYVDRRYYHLDVHHQAMIDYIISQKWAYKQFNSYDESFDLFFKVPDGEGKYEPEECTLKYNYDYNFSTFPYMDTLKYYEDGVLTNNKNIVDDYYTLVCADGSYCYDDDEDVTTCIVCGDTISIDEAIYIDDEGYVCHCHTVEDQDGNYILKRDSVILHLSNGTTHYIHENDVDDYVCYEEEYYESDDHRLIYTCDMSCEEIEKLLEDSDVYETENEDYLIRL